MNSVVPWLAFATSVLSLLLARAGWLTSREKLRLDLYNRRFQIYSSALDLHHAVSAFSTSQDSSSSSFSKAYPDLGALHTSFVRASRESLFLFDRESGVYDKLKQFNEDVVFLVGYERHIAGNKGLDEENRQKMYSKYLACLKRNEEVFPMLEKRMAAYLNFHSLYGR